MPPRHRIEVSCAINLEPIQLNKAALTSRRLGTDPTAWRGFEEGLPEAVSSKLTYLSIVVLEDRDEPFWVCKGLSVAEGAGGVHKSIEVWLHSRALVHTKLFHLSPETGLSRFASNAATLVPLS